MYHLKVEFCFIQHTFLGCQVREAASQVSLRKLLEVGGEPGYLGVLWLLNVKRLLLMKENQIAQVKEFIAFLCMRRCKSLGSLKSVLWYPPQLSGASILCFHVLSFLKLHLWGWLQLVGRYSLSPSWVPSGLTFRGYQVAAIAGGCNFFYLLTWQAISYFSIWSINVSVVSHEFVFQKMWKKCMLKSFYCPFFETYTSENTVNKFN